MYQNHQSLRYSKIKNKDKQMEKDVHSSTESEDEDNKYQYFDKQYHNYRDSNKRFKFENQDWAWEPQQLERIQLDSDTIKRDYRKLTCQSALKKED